MATPVANVDIAELVRFIAKNLVDKQDEVHVALVEERQASVYELEVAESDLGKIIGRSGKTARLASVTRGSRRGCACASAARPG